jgi:hypothetical protein
MQTNDIKIKYNNKVSDKQTNPCVVVFTDITNSPDASAIAWQVINDACHTFNYTLATSIQVKWNQGNSGTCRVEVKNSSWLFEDTGKAFSLVENNSMATANQFEVINKASISGGISVIAFKDNNPIAVKHTVAKGQKAKFVFQPKLYWAVVDNIGVGDIIYLEDLSSYTEISLEDLKSLTVTLKGGLTAPYTFTVSEKIPTSGRELIEPIPPCPPEKPSKSEEGIEILVEMGEHHDLFPFVYMRTLPKISPEERQGRFVEYDYKNAPSDSLYKQLIAIKNNHPHEARLQMQKLAMSFILDQRFTDQLIQNINDIKGDIKYFARLNSWFRQQFHMNFRQLKAKFEDVLKLDWNHFKQYLKTPEYHKEKERVWQNFFALTIMLDYHPHRLEEFTKILVMCNLLERIIVDAEHSNGGSENAIDDTSPNTSQEILEAARASIILPQKLFPLPPATKGDSPSKAEAKEWVEPYAIGDLQLVRQRLLRYELGEVAHIENVLKGERKETTQRKLNRVNESVTNAREQLEETDTDIQGTRADILNETRKTLDKDTVTTTFNDFKATYGSPTTVTYTGSWSLGNAPENPYIENVTNFAKKITTRTANRIARYVNQVRSLSILDEAEEIVIHAFDNTAITSNVIGIYRWVNKIYKVHVVNYGHRLMIQFLLQNPAHPYITNLFQLKGISLEPPITPDKLNLKSYPDVTRVNYPQLATMYDIQPPPIEVKIIPAAFKDGEPINLKKISIPEGYRADNAWVACVFSGVTELTGFVGKETFTLTPSQNQTNIKMNQEDSAIAVSVMCNTEQADKKYCVTIEVKCTLTPEKYEEWQIKTYNAILEGYRQQKAEYYERAGVGKTEIGSHNPRENRKIENNELKKGCTKQLLKQHFQLVGASEDTAIAQLRYIQFFEQAFEWDEMTYQFSPPLQEQESSEDFTATALNYYSGTDSIFTNFLQAESARVLLPVRPDYAMLVLYYLSSGMIWPGENALTPTNEKYVSLVNELKILPKVDRECNHVSKPWEITIPTSMIMLQDSSKLPQFPVDL